MIKSIKLTNYVGEELTIVLDEHEPDHGLLIESIEGLGPPKSTINMTTLATSDGSLYNSARAETRNIVISLLFTLAPTIEDSRLRTYKYFPLKKPLEFLIETDNRIAKTVGYVESNQPNIFSDKSGNQVSIVCDDPYFYSAGENGVNVTIFYGIEPLFEFIFSNESLDDPLLEFGEIQNEREKTIYYEGDAEIGIVITIHALDVAKNITIYNAGTREVMRINTDKIPGGFQISDDIIISTVRGDKYIRLLRNGIYTNILNALDKYSDWFLLAKGDNVFAYTAEEGVDNLQFTIENRIIYWGV